MRTITKELYTFDELSDTAKQKALESLSDINTDYEWWNYEDYTNIGKIFGIQIDKIYFSGFSSQGDGACFEGHYRYNKDAPKKIREYAPLDTRLHDIADTLQSIQKGQFYQLMSDTKHRGHYYHENCTETSVYRNDNKDITREVEKQLIDTLKDFMKWIYRSLEKDYDHLTSEEAIKETIQLNEYEFYETGEQY